MSGGRQMMAGQGGSDADLAAGGGSLAGDEGAAEEAPGAEPEQAEQAQQAKQAKQPRSAAAAEEGPPSPPPPMGEADQAQAAAASADVGAGALLTASIEEAGPPVAAPLAAPAEEEGASAVAAEEEKEEGERQAGQEGQAPLVLPVSPRASASQQSLKVRRCSCAGFGIAVWL